MKKIFYIAVSACLLAGCNNFEPVPENNLTEQSSWPKTHTVQEFLDAYMTPTGVLFPVRTRSYYSESTSYSASENYGLFSIDTLPTVGNDIVIRGRVVSDDYAGNLYKTLVIQDSEHPEQGLRISVDAGSISGLYPMGTLLNIRCNGLSVGKYAYQPQLCAPSYNSNTNAYNSTSKMGWAPGRIAYPVFAQAVQVIGVPQLDKIEVDTIDITEIKNVTASLIGKTGNMKTQLDALSADIQRLNGRLVCIKNVHFTWQYDYNGTALTCTTGDPETDGNTYCFAPTTGNQGYPQGRYIADGAGNMILVSTSEYAKFAKFILPDTECVGTVTGVLGFYYDRAKYNVDGGEWGLTIRSLDDLQLFDAEGNLWQRKEWTAE